MGTLKKYQKYADDTVVIGLIRDNNEDEYRQTISYNSDWCSENYLDLNVTKMKEMILDMRKKQNSKTPVTISNSSVAVVSSYKYLSVIIQDNLKWKNMLKHKLRKPTKECTMSDVLRN